MVPRAFLDFMQKISPTFYERNQIYLKILITDKKNLLIIFFFEIYIIYLQRNLNVSINIGYYYVVQKYFEKDIMCELIIQ